MRWETLPGPAGFIGSAIERLRDGVSVVVAAPYRGASGLEDAICNALDNDRWRVQRITAEPTEDPLRWVTEQLYMEPDQWLTWNVEKLCQGLSRGQVIAVQGVDRTDWEAWRTFLREFEVASRQRPSDERPMFLVVLRGVARKHLQLSGAALEVMIWSGVVGELDSIIYVDQRLRSLRKAPKHHKLIVRQIVALSLWDLQLADFLMTQPESSIFDVNVVLNASTSYLGKALMPISAEWEEGGSNEYDGERMLHPWILFAAGDPDKELVRRLWTAQAAELLPLIELRRRGLLKGLERDLKCPFMLNDRLVNSLHELEIGALAHVARKNGLKGDLRDRTELLADCRNKLAHLSLLSSADALDSRLYG